MAEVSVATSRSTNYIEVHVELVDHPKTKRLARLLQISPIYVQAHLVEMWKWVMAYAPGGDLTRFDALDIADGACWEGDPEAFVEALCSCGTGGGIGFLERTATGKLIVHDWHQYGGKLLVTRFCDRFRKSHHRQPTPFEIQSAGLFPPEMYAASGIATPLSEPSTRSSDGFQRIPPDSNVEEKSLEKRSEEEPREAKRSEEKPPPNAGAREAGSAGPSPGLEERRPAAALAPEGGGGGEPIPRTASGSPIRQVAERPRPPERDAPREKADPDAMERSDSVADATARSAIEGILARCPALAAELQAIEARKLARGESIGNPQRWRAAMLATLDRQQRERQAAAAENPQAAREEVHQARIVRAPKPRRPIPPDWLPGVHEEEARRLLNAAREDLLARRDPTPPGPERDEKLVILARGYWQRAHPDAEPPWPAVGESLSPANAAVPVTLSSVPERHGAQRPCRPALHVREMAA